MLLNDIIDLATDNQQSVTVLLRKCLVIANQLRNERLKLWANGELNGYLSEKDTPEYRVISSGAIGRYIGPGWAQCQQIIPSAVLKIEHRHFAEKVWISQSVKTLEHLLDSGGETVSFPWPDNLVLLYQDKLMGEWTLAAAWQRVPKSVIAGILDTIRTRILNMALEVRDEVGEADGHLKELTPQIANKVNDTVVNNIYGSNVYVSAGHSSMTATTVQQSQQNLVAGDWECLSQVLRSVNLPQEDLAELSDAVSEDHNRLGAKVHKWIAKTAPKVMVGGVKMAATVGTTVLTEYLKQYFGLK